MLRLGGGVVHRTEPARMLRLFCFVKPAAVPAMRQMQVELALNAAREPLVQRILDQFSCFLTVHFCPSFPLDEPSGRTVRAIFARTRFFAS